MTDSPLALQLAARVEKLDPPLVDDIYAAAALAVIELLEDERSQPSSETGEPGEWHEAVAAWNGARIRKIMRRGRASAWLRAQDVPGVTVRVGTAEVRAFVPGPLDEAPRDLAKLQIQSSPLDEPELIDERPLIEPGEWHEAVAAWNGARIRKIMRRGRASAWQRAQDVPGVTVRVGTAEVRAFVPGPLDEAPRDLAKLQIQSSPLDEPELIDERPLIEAGELVIAVTPDLEMSWGKLAAQCAHAGQRAWERAAPERRDRWRAMGSNVRLLHPDAGLWDELRTGPVVEIRDGGFTEIPAGSLTAIGWIE